MTYQVLARLWRPRKFEDVVGQDYTVRALSYALDNQKLHSAYLFAGSHGVGKTSLARIVARAMNCEQGISAKPCDTCSSCLSLLSGQAVDVIEIDAASRTKVEDTRDLLDQVQYAPTMSRYKIYIIDEVHMLSTHSFNALLKTLEEPPSHVIFLLATTHPDKLPVTVRSRCLQLFLKPIVTSEIAAQLQKITEKDAIIAETAALDVIAKAARGSMRDALSLLDQAIAVSQGKVNLNDVNAMLGLANSDILRSIVQALLARNLPLLLDIVRQYYHLAASLPAMLLELCQQAALFQFAPDSVATQGDTGELIKQLAKQASAETLQLYYQLSLHAIDDIAKAPSPLLAIEMWLLRLLHFDLANQTDMTEPTTSVENVSPPVNTTKNHITPELAKATADMIAPNLGPINVSLSSMDLADKPRDADERNVMDSVNKLQDVAKKHIEQPNTPKASDVDVNQLPDWPSLLAKLNLTGILRILAEQAELHWLDAKHATFKITHHQANLCQKEQLQSLKEAISKAIGHEVELSLVLVESCDNSPTMLAKRQAEQAKQAVLTKLPDNEKIQAILKAFDATIDPKSVVLTSPT